MRLWERRTGDADFAQIRVGRGPVQLSTPLVAPQTAPMEELEPLAAAAMHTFLKAHGTLQDLPLAVSLRAFYHITVCGDPDTVYGNVRAMIAQLTTLHSPDDLLVTVAAAPGAVEEWEWTKWLPHNQHRKDSDGAGSRRLRSPPASVSWSTCSRTNWRGASASCATRRRPRTSRTSSS